MDFVLVLCVLRIVREILEVFLVVKNTKIESLYVITCVRKLGLSHLDIRNWSGESKKLGEAEAKPSIKELENEVNKKPKLTSQTDSTKCLAEIKLISTKCLNTCLLKSEKNKRS